MTSAAFAPLPLQQRVLTRWRRFFRWVTSPHVILAIIMLFLMFYMVIIPLFRMVMTTITYAENDVRYAPGAVPGVFTAFHWLRMLTTKIGAVMTLPTHAAFLSRIIRSYRDSIPHRGKPGVDGGSH